MHILWNTQIKSNRALCSSLASTMPYLVQICTHTKSTMANTMVGHYALSVSPVPLYLKLSQFYSVLSENLGECATRWGMDRAILTFHFVCVVVNQFRIFYFTTVKIVPQPQFKIIFSKNLVAGTSRYSQLGKSESTPVSVLVPL